MQNMGTVAYKHIKTFKELIYDINQTLMTVLIIQKIDGFIITVEEVFNFFNGFFLFVSVEICCFILWVKIMVDILYKLV
jgi:hypothetical protein